MKFKIKIGKKVFDVSVFDLAEGIKIKVGEKVFLFNEEENKNNIFHSRVFFPKRDFSKKEIVSPISGIVSEIFVKKGDVVKKEQKLISLSAMKMENEILSDYEGKIKEIFVTKNQKVEKGKILMVLE